MNLLVSIAARHLLARRRQSLVSLMGIVIGVGFFLSISSLMQGSENDFIRRLVDNAPHITISDEYRTPKAQPLQSLYPRGAVELRSVKPLTETRGIRGYRQTLETLRTNDGLIASPVLTGQGIVSFAGRDVNISLSGMIPEEIAGITTIEENMREGSIEALIANPSGIIVGVELVRQMGLALGDNLTVAASTGQVRTFKIVGIFRTGRADYDERQTFIDLKRMQALMNRPNRANSIIIKLDDPDAARDTAARIEAMVGYKSLSWQEANEDLLSTLIIRNVIMYSVVSAVLVVAAFGIYNVISTVVMEKQRDIAILKSIGLTSRDIRRIFLYQGFMLGSAGVLVGLPFGMALMGGLMQVTIHVPGGDAVQMPMDWSLPQFLIAGGFAMGAALLAAFLPARKGARVLPVDVLRGGH